MITTIQNLGNSQGIRIQKNLLDEVHWNESEKLNISIVDGKIIIEKVKQRKNIKELFADFDGEYTPEEIDLGESVGRKMW